MLYYDIAILPIWIKQLRTEMVTSPHNFWHGKRL